MRSLRTQLLWLLSGLVLLFVLMQGVVVFAGALHEANEVLDYLQTSIARSLQHGEFDSVVSGLDAADDEGEFEFVIQVSAEGARLYLSDPDAVLPLLTRPGFSEVAAARPSAANATPGGPWRVYTLQGEGHTIQVAQSLPLRRSFALGFALRSLLSLVILAPLLLFGVRYVVNRALKPLRGVVAQLEDRAADHLEPLDPGGVLPEMQPVVRAMNNLLGRIRAAFETQRNFVSGAAHELRSPLAAVKVQAQMLGRAPDETTRALALQRLIAGVDRSAHLVDQLLALAREEDGAADAAAQEPGSLHDAAQLALADVAMLALERGSDVGLAEAVPVQVGVPTDSLRVLVRNLVDNAVRHSPPGAQVDVKVGATPQGALLEVSDSGPGIPEADFGRVFDRFYRRPGAVAGGSGIGLAIVQAIAQRHGAQVELGRSGLGGLRVSVRFPGLRVVCSPH